MYYGVVYDNHRGDKTLCLFTDISDARCYIDDCITEVVDSIGRTNYDLSVLQSARGAELYVSNSNIYHNWDILETDMIEERLYGS